MRSKYDGGPIFAQPGISMETPEDGLTLRDWFAGQALVICYKRINPDYAPDFDEIAAQAYSFADAMLAWRENS